MGDRRVRRTDFLFERPSDQVATMPPEMRGLARDEVRLLVSTPRRHEHARFKDLSSFLAPGSVLVVNRSATLPASLPAKGRVGPFMLNLSTRYHDGLWLAEPRWDRSRPGPLPLVPGETIEVAGLRARLITPYPGLKRLWFTHVQGGTQDDLEAAMARAGEPIRYGYLEPPLPPLAAYQTIFSTVPGSAEMPSAGRPFTQRLLEDLDAHGIAVMPIELHAGVSSLEHDLDAIDEPVLYPEPFRVPVATAAAINHARRAGAPVIAVGTTVVRALESAFADGRIRAVEGFTRLYVHPRRRVEAVDGLVTGFHDPLASHLAMLHALAGDDCIRTAYAQATREGYLWHEFGDSHLILRDSIRNGR
ncbi:S-adenosylmethionine:tRNA ribosyltransferase-isomerase [Rhizobiales bacterium GAS191]|nr:S-adenosylmethionine:tRNA ribosyltransferase-isomerase [Rhizobiales bacterium GAS188]SEC91172.1 S-adenosylmethionine:tRNA ribosyltransferase-isomerase [Rhizobiales bacterium GAS191]